MKIWSVFSLVIVFHVAILGLLLVQPGCQSTSADKPDPSMTSTGTSKPYVTPAQQDQLDPAFNGGMASAPSSSRSGSMSAPTRPAGASRTTPQTGMLEPVLEPVRDDLSVPSATKEYTVGKGDTLSGIAKKQGVSLSALLSANGLSKSSTIYVGQTLQVPVSQAADESAPAEMEHSGKEVVVGKGDTLSAIAARTGTSVKTLKAMNGLTSDTIFVGQRLAVPESATVTVTAPPPSAPATQSAPVPQSGQSSYTVQPGDTPSGIARKFGISSAQLMAANNISDPRKLVVGKTLVIPVSGSTGTASAASQSASRPLTTSSSSTQTRPSAPPVNAEPTVEDPMSVLEALEDEDLPFVEVEVVEEEPKTGN